ncbi:threonine/serine exporter family protein [Haloechinothrix sp. LS1_15]|nr:threonine/serine exporter family protein [Haloechinothrix sp. LS1_15]
MGPSLPDDNTVHFVLDLSLRIGEIQMSTGAGASDVTATILAVTDALGLPHCEVDVIYTSISVTCHRGTDTAPVTALRVVRFRSLDYSRLTAVEQLIRQITRGQISAEAAYTELRRIAAAPHPYPRWLATLALGGMAASVAVLIGAGAATALLAFLTSAAIDRVGRLLNRYALPVFFQQVAGSFIATLIALGAITVDVGWFHRPSFVAAAAITVLLSGLATVSTVQDAITGYHVTAAGRATEVAMMSAGLLTGVVIAFQAAVALGFDGHPLPPSVIPTPESLPLMTVAGASTAGFFALASYSRLRPMLVAAAAGAVGAGVFHTLRLFEADQIVATAVAATVLGFCGGLMARRLKVAPLVVAVSGITPLLPGLLTYRGLYELAVLQTGDITTLMSAIAVGLSLAAGVVLGEYLAQPVRTKLGRLERKLAGPRLAGPLRPTKRRIE